MADTFTVGPNGTPYADMLTRSGEQLQNKLRAVQGSPLVAKSDQLKESAQEFEAIFVAQLLKIMRDTIQEAGTTDGIGLGKEIYTELFDQELARSIARRGPLGIGDLLVKRLSEEAPVEGAKAASEPTTDAGRLPTLALTSISIGGSESSFVRLHQPVAGPVSSGYGLRKDPFTHQVRFHKGLDVAVPRGTPVTAAMDGEVTFAGERSGYGNMVVLRHPDGLETRYAHLEATNVKAGDLVRSEQVLGVVGSTGRSTGPHLHFEVVRSGEPAEPRTGI